MSKKNRNQIRILGYQFYKNPLVQYLSFQQSQKKPFLSLFSAIPNGENVGFWKLCNKIFVEEFSFITSTKLKIFFNSLSKNFTLSLSGFS